MSCFAPKIRLLLALLTFTAGCGLDQDDMRKYALNRPSDDELSGNAQRSPAAPATPADAATSGAQADAAKPLPSTAPEEVTASTPGTATAPGGAHGATVGSSGTTEDASGTAELSDTRSPDTALTDVQRRQITIDNMTRIVRALEAYRADNGQYPASAIHSSSGQPLLSWRVVLLPYLGYQSLYEQFRRDEPWNSAHNQTLMAMIPAVYQSPERFDTNTNYLVPIGKTAAFASPRGNHPRRWEDGLENIVLLLEVDDDAAVPWTSTGDWSFDPRSPGRQLGSLRRDGFFAGWGGGTLAMVPRGTADGDLRAMFTVDGGESFQAAAICQSAQAESVASPHGLVSAPTSQSSGSARDTAQASSAEQAGWRSNGGKFDHTSDTTAGEWVALSQQALSAGLESEAAQLAMAAFLVDEPGATATHRWIPALRRPTTGLRFGVGVDYSGANSESIRRQLSHQADRRVHGSSQLTTVLGELAPPIFDQLQSAPWRGTSSADPNDAPRTVSAGPIRTQAPWTMLGVAPARRLVRAAQLADLDLLLLFDVEDKTTSSGMQSKSVQFSVWDTWNSREILKLPRVNYLRRRHEQTDPLFRDPIEIAAESFAEFIRTQLQPEPLPEALKPTHAAHRIAHLAKLKRDNPLPLLSEMKFYRERGLVSVDELMRAYHVLLGSKTGSDLLAGNIEEKRSAISRWIPDLPLHRLSARPGE